MWRFTGWTARSGFPRLARFVVTHMLPTMTRGAEGGIDLIDSLATNFGNVQAAIDPGWPTTQDLDREYQVLEGLLRALQTTIDSLTTVEPSIASSYREVLETVSEAGEGGVPCFAA